MPRSHKAERAAAIAHIAQNALLFNDKALGVMPLYHTMGVRILLSSALLSGTFVCQPKFRPEATLELIEHHGISSLYLVPTLYYDLIYVPGFERAALETVKHLGFAGASMSDGLLNKLTVAFPGVQIVNHYGSSEIYTYTINQDATRKPGSAGRAGLNAEIAIIPLETEGVSHRVQKAYVEGQVIAREDSAEAFTGYLNRPDATKAAFKNGWYLTGDVGYFDEEGELFLTGRVDDMIITGGENVMPIGIESILSLHDDILEVIVVGKPHERLGQRITAFVVARRSIEFSELDDHCRAGGLPGYRCPKEYVFVDQIPKSPVGKTLRRLL